jgi:DNA-binding MarR family transcriptional regulator
LNIEDQIVVSLRRIARAMDLWSRTLLQRYGLTTPQLTALLAIARLQPVTAGVVAREIHLGHSTVTGILDRLERRGWIGRARGDRDRRSLSLCLTAEGQRFLAGAPNLLQSGFGRRLAALEPWERTQILATLQRLAEMMDGQDSEETAEPGSGHPGRAGAQAARTGRECRPR